MTSPDDEFRAYFREVTPAAFPPCPPTPDPVMPSSRSTAAARRLVNVNRAVLALAASLFLGLAFLLAPSTPAPGTNDKGSSLLNEASANGKSLQPRGKSLPPSK